jgi:ABC-type multidrug transport system fused ATPase/permease subunit
MSGIKALAENRTTFIIAHRLSTIRSCDLIVVLRDGVIAEQGTFAALMRRKGVFSELYNSQFSGDDTASPATGKRQQRKRPQRQRQPA